MPKKIAITTSSFGKVENIPLEILKENDFEYVLNPYGRALAEEEIESLLSDCCGVIAGTERYSGETLRKLKQIQVISRCGVGMDNIDAATAKEMGIKVCNTPDGPTKPVAELVIGLVFNLLRKISEMDRNVRKGVWKKFMGSLFEGKEFGIIGFGRIGQTIGQLANKLGAKVFYFDPHKHDFSCEYADAIAIDELVARADILSVNVPLEESTRGLVNKDLFKRMKEGIIFINCSRGGIVNEQDLCEALREGIIAGAAMDVFEQEPYDGMLKEFENVILTPHVGSYAKEARLRMEIDAVNNLISNL
jgi:D-3-phosphoglycerate dehydrogenase